MTADEPSWTVVRAVDLSPSRRRLEFWINGTGKRFVTIDTELDTPDYRRRIVDALVADDRRRATPRGPEPARPGDLSPWLST